MKFLQLISLFLKMLLFVLPTVIIDWLLFYITFLLLFSIGSVSTLTFTDGQNFTVRGVFDYVLHTHLDFFGEMTTSLLFETLALPAIGIVVLLLVSARFRLLRLIISLLTGITCLAAFSLYCYLVFVQPIVDTKRMYLTYGFILNSALLIIVSYLFLFVGYVILSRFSRCDYPLWKKTIRAAFFALIVGLGLAILVLGSIVLKVVRLKHAEAQQVSQQVTELKRKLNYHLSADLPLKVTSEPLSISQERRATIYECGGDKNGLTFIQAIKAKMATQTILEEERELLKQRVDIHVQLQPTIEKVRVNNKEGLYHISYYNQQPSRYGLSVYDTDVIFYLSATPRCTEFTSKNALLELASHIATDR